MKWHIPAKTFLLGEYAAIVGKPAILLTTFPCFEMTLSHARNLQGGIHPESPAGLWWAQSGVKKGLSWYDPYQGRGGMGASSAQFLGAYLASAFDQKKWPCQEEMLEAYFKLTWSGQGLRPSGYDVLAQSWFGCVYLNRQQGQYQTYLWPFHDLAFVLLHTGQKLTTHHHLKSVALPAQMNQLVRIVDSAKLAFKSADSQRIIDAVNDYHEQLSHQRLVAKHSKQWVESLKQQTDILAAKGCGAMGADVILLLVYKNKLISLIDRLSANGWDILATSENLYIQNNPKLTTISLRPLVVNLR